MSEPHDEVVRVAAGEMVQIELYQQALTEAGIESKVVGDSLGAAFGSVLPNAMELYVREADLAQAEATLKTFEAERATAGEMPS